ncbi:MAG: hypothetical protein NW217_12600 [Hyphomicrobiaceae bacterium]|nr:hypothetical protein [Hyphomicrobiaceae bacterium]
MTSFDERQMRRDRWFGLLQSLFMAMAVAYLVAHSLLTWHVYATNGVLAAGLTFVTLGLGDAYWAIRLLADEGASAQALAALATATFYFGSLAAKPWVNRYLARLGADMLDDFGREIATLAPPNDDHEPKSPPSEATPRSDRA